MIAFLGVFLHAIGGFAAASFYIPFKKVKNWAWESYWIISGIAAWLIMPWLVAILTVPNLISILELASSEDIFWCYFFGLLWGIGGFTFGLSMRYLGLSLGMSLALGCSAAFGTIIPPIYNGTFGELLSIPSGQITLLGVIVCLAGIAICGYAGMSKEKELSEEEKIATIKEFNFGKGVLVAICSGILSACMAFGLAAGKPIALIAVENGVKPLWQNNLLFIIIFAGGLTINFLWCIALNIKNNTTKNYIESGNASLIKNYIFSSMAGIIWYFQFMFYGMGSTKMGEYEFASWSIHMAFIIVFSNLWGLYFGEWKGSSKRTLRIIIFGIVVVIISTFLIGLGNYLAS